MKFGRCKFTIKFYSQIWVRKFWQSWLDAKCDKEWCGFDGLVEGGVVAEHERAQILLPVKSIISDKILKVFGDRFVSYFYLTVTCQMS
jgi:hypothetical protein